MHHTGPTIQIIEALTKLARGTLDANGIAELRRQLAPYAPGESRILPDPTPTTYAELKAGGYIDA